MWILVSSNQQQLPENRITTNPEYTNTQQGLPDMGILIPQSRHASLLALEFIFAGKRLIVDPYFQYFSLSLMYKYQIGLHKHLEQTWYIILIFQEYNKHIFHLRPSTLIPLLYYDVTQWPRLSYPRVAANQSDLTLQCGPNQHGTYMPRRTIHTNPSHMHTE